MQEKLFNPEDIQTRKIKKKLPESGIDLLLLISLRDPSQQQWRMGSSKNHKNIGKVFLNVFATK